MNVNLRELDTKLRPLNPDLSDDMVAELPRKLGKLAMIGRKMPYQVSLISGML